MENFVGARLKIPAWSDWFMRGETHCAVRKIGRKWVHVTGIRSGAKWRVALELINAEDGYTVSGEVISLRHS